MAKKRKITLPRKEIKVRIKQVGPLEQNLPVTARLFLDALMNYGKLRSHLSFGLNILPPTVNHMYKHTRFGTRLTQEAKSFRELVYLAIGSSKFTYKSTGAAAVLIFLESPNWVTKKLTIAEMDIDNRIKPILDAVKETIQVPDETNWELHVWKLASKKKRTTVHLFDLGDLIDYYS